MKVSLSLLFLLFLISPSYSQYDIEDVKNDDLDTEGTTFISKIKPRIYVGGEGSISLGVNGTYLFGAPLVGYEIIEKVSVGFSAMYQLYRINTGTQVFNFNSYGLGTFVRLKPMRQVILQAEYDIFNTIDLDVPTGDRVNVYAVMAGAGYANYIGPNIYYQLLLMYDFINNPNMPLTPFIFQPLHLKLGLVWYPGRD